jgi:hypothetical protein
MNTLLVPILSMLALTGLALAARTLMQARICPVCVGVGATWLWMIVAREFGHPVDITMLALLLGGSVVGIANLAERRLPPRRSPLVWKTLFIPTGFVAAYCLAVPLWGAFAVSSLGLALLAGVFLRSPAAPSAPGDAVEALKKRMQQCC